MYGAGVLDNGRGFARNQVFKHLHEIETGQTSSISTSVISFDFGETVTCIFNSYQNGNKC